MTAILATRRDGQTRIHVGSHMGHLSTCVFARGPWYASMVATDLPAARSPEGADAGYFVDHDARRAVIFDTSVMWDVDPDDARVNGWRIGTDVHTQALRELDLHEAEDCLFEVMAGGATPEQWFDGLRGLSLHDSWAGWTLEWLTPGAFVQELSGA